MVRILISGYREYTDYDRMQAIIKSLSDSPHLILGDCRGTDLTALQIALNNGWSYVTFTADWSQGLRAGPLRNERMIVEGKPDLALLFLSPNSKGTLNMKNLCDRYHIPYSIINI